MSKRGQFEMSFGMIFSIILIVAFIIVAFVVINSFFGVQCSAEEGIFIKDLQNEVDRVWRGAGAETNYNGKISGCKIERVCFWDSESQSKGKYASLENEFRIFTDEEGNHNLYFSPRKESHVKSVFIKNINISSLSENPKCFEKIEDKIKIPLNKNLNEALVRIS